ncbi:hypothetical protein TAJ_49 [Mycobacterium phage Taj]|uniref:Helix-turn-helix DNA binding domain protein n=2 Tax=Gracegardnervirinae TaxID=2946632 RepID=A0A385DZV9_9CAUD|nr:hypothetical protein TAJ_49 [Mycobacterium phage Taj]YP_009841075.1 hypothetical protein HWB85_gp050 [Mycobacterium phage Renaud18]AFO10234.1 hypothetical protein TAJ_49 [Mycobacterium phage Taj]AXQ65021.1 hypothetical protein SEA_RENAUD18_50 [Mycobacterium phage Renaud18]
MSPPGRLAVTDPRGMTTRDNALTGSQLQVMQRAAHLAFADTDGGVVTPAKINRLVRRFGHRLRRAGINFDELFALPPQRQRAALGDPDLLRVIAYADPTGETAVNRVMRQAQR